MHEIILASASPRRKQLLEQIGLKFRCIPAGIDEECLESLSPPAMVSKLACNKAQVVAQQLKQGIVIAADTVVVLDDFIMGKPVNREDAEQKLSLLSARAHQVMTGLCIFNCKDQSHLSEVEITKVFFRSLSHREINAYLDSAEWVDKAGGYGIQGLGALLIEKIEGCYFNVVGLPLNRLNQMLGKQGVYLLGRTTPYGLQSWD